MRLCIGIQHHALHHQVGDGLPRVGVNNMQAHDGAGDHLVQPACVRVCICVRKDSALLPPCGQTSASFRAHSHDVLPPCVPAHALLMSSPQALHFLHVHGHNAFQHALGVTRAIAMMIF
eukprot:scaffold228167_cov21-Tisochrysis_lutea.AAC.1